MDTFLPMECGVQPLDGIMEARGLSNADLVGASTRQLTFKMVSKGRKGRRVTPNVQSKILAALNSIDKTQTYTLKDLFNY